VFEDEHVKAIELVQDVKLADGSTQHKLYTLPSTSSGRAYRPCFVTSAELFARKNRRTEKEWPYKDLPTLRLRLKKPKSKKQVKWGEDTVDNEHLNKKKSKCCCIYNKPRAFGESSDSEDDDECDNCHGHVERRKKARGEGGGDQDTAPTSTPPPLVPA
ncbi:E3 ubiquitin-protein ligase PPP1R11-like, partial [Macrosteles quadrilineatus]|uniref:E3 ubiquitin-protein ligase PPP1R11-like n=1 Tax=Macrosteles quadrilineatus TaxID=74068 RepID=UPI0023E2100D